MGVYYKLVNWATKERIEPQHLGKGGIKFGAMIFGPSARLFMLLHVNGETGWEVLPDTDERYDETDLFDSPSYFINVTEKYRLQFNAHFEGATFFMGEEHVIERSEYGDEEHEKTCARLFRSATYGKEEHEKTFTKENEKP